MNQSENEVPEYSSLKAFETEKRKRTRVPDLTSSEVLFRTTTEGEQLGRLEDISLGGFAVTGIAEASGFIAGRELIAYFEEGLVKARVKYTVANKDGGYRVGLEWSQPRSSAVIDILTRCVNAIYAHIAANSRHAVDDIVQSES